jgi:hypothetical protein
VFCDYVNLFFIIQYVMFIFYVNKTLYNQNNICVLLFVFPGFNFDLNLYTVNSVLIRKYIGQVFIIFVNLLFDLS